MNKIIMVLVVVTLAIFFYPKSYISSPGFVTPEGQAEFNQGAKKCFGFSYLTNPEAMAADAPGKSLCFGWLGQQNSGAPNINLDTKYISVVDWPPQLQIIAEPFTCAEAGAETARAGITERRLINGRVYCVTRESEGAAGSIYTNYAYAFARADQTAIFTFSLRVVQCANYEEVQKIACETERSSFNPDPIIDQMARTLK